MVEWSISAKEDLKQVHDYISKDSRFYARKVTEQIIDKSEALNNFPEMGRVVPEIGDANIRELFVYSYRLIYEVTSPGVQVLALIHGRREFPSDRFMTEEINRT
jgi:addiction module RelE/StbE family toxin